MSLILCILIISIYEDVIINKNYTVGGVIFDGIINKHLWRALFSILLLSLLLFLGIVVIVIVINKRLPYALFY